MLRMIADENLHNALIRGVLRQEPGVDFCRVQDVGLDGIDDPGLLQWAADEERIVVTHDVNTLIQFAKERIQRGEPMPGVFIVSQYASFGAVIQDLVLLAQCSTSGEWESQIVFLPL